MLSLNPAHDEVYIQHYVIKSVVFSGYSGFLQTDHQDMTEILLKVALNTITPNPLLNKSFYAKLSENQ